MKILIHYKAKYPIKVISSDPEEIKLVSTTCTGALWELAEKFPEELIGWCEQDIVGNLFLENWKKVFHHDFVMASFPVKNSFLPESIGYVDTMPFINITKNVSYGTWLMSSDVGGLRGAVLQRFFPLLKNEKNLGYLLNSIAKIGQQNGLFCYSEPELVKSSQNNYNSGIASKRDLFRFVYQHYTFSRVAVLLLCFLIYEKSFPFLSYVRSFFNTKHYRKAIDLSGDINVSKKKIGESETIDVIIPTMGRSSYIYDVLKDFSAQTHLPKRIIIIEQNPDPSSFSDLDFIKTEIWPFEIVHHFIHRTGACNARNIALEIVQSDYVFFADDDIRLGKNLLENIFTEIKKYSICALNLNCRQPGEQTTFGKIKQWGSFGSGTTVVKSNFAKRCKFIAAFEHGHGEDADFGKQLRDIGCDIIYHPELELLHLKAPIGGFRQKPELEWEKEKPLPKPSPTVMVYAIRNYTREQMRGYQVSLYIKFYSRQGIKNPISYISSMRKKWRKSADWAKKLMKEKGG
ncbi:glycosyltransferase family 2 protein [Antarcticibacterium arcticum]|uniref:Glycosyltransferase family 2 protein n=1 Tax=Antarcticibacterium arcticum TaxID=2585771 RepID=A0A5B8YNB7_9FLAO|nr:glycosyltransferase family A protein [Antarcticibacterium arcticum]QED37746.1 glycosyltransferase family 2 protein [Antarcticibacterium arcticum]